MYNQIPKENNIIHILVDTRRRACVYFKKKGGTWAKNNKNNNKSSRAPICIIITVDCLSASISNFQN